MGYLKYFLSAYKLYYSFHSHDIIKSEKSHFLIKHFIVDKTGAI